MSRYGDYIPTSHQPARPAPEWQSSYRQSSPNQWNPYGPPPSVPPFLYAPGPSDYQSHMLDAPPPLVQIARPNYGAHSIHPSLNNAGPSKPNKGREYLQSLGSSMAALNIGQRTHSKQQSHHAAPISQISTPRVSDKPLPELPPAPPLPARPATIVLETYPSLAPSPASRARPTTQPPVYPSHAEQPIRTPPKSFKPSPYLHLPVPPHTPPPGRPHSAPSAGASSSSSRRRAAGQVQDVIDVTLDSPSSSQSYSSPSSPVAQVTPRSPARLRRRGASDQPQPSPISTPSRSSRPHDPATPKTVPSRTNAIVDSSHPTPNNGSPASTATRCAGYTRTGERCKRTVKVEAPYLAAMDLNLQSSGSGRSGGQDKGKAKGKVPEDDEGEDDQGGRYCKDHAGMICSVEGYYSRDRPGLWVRFDDWVPAEMSQQTKALLRTTMESRLTAKESPGFIYAYELRDLQAPSTSYYKVGRTDNVPRRIGEWTNQCQSKTPTLRDIYPLSSSRISTLPSTSSSTTSSPLHRSGTLNRSFLPGAISSGTTSTSPPNPSVKRWEKLIHLELADISASTRKDEWEGLRGKCTDCGKVHREVFAIPRYTSEGSAVQGQAQGQGQGEGSYQVVLEVICRWERFTRMTAPVVAT